MKKLIIAIVDNKAGEPIGNYLFLHNNIATAVRMFEDVATSQQSVVGAHLEDFDLVKLGELSNEGDIETLINLPDHVIIVSGKEMKTMLSARVPDPKNLRREK